MWSRDSRRIAFTWERAGVANLYVVPADGSAKPTQVTTEGVPGGYFWSADSQSIQFLRGTALMAMPLERRGGHERDGDPGAQRRASPVTARGSCIWSAARLEPAAGEAGADAAGVDAAARRQLRRRTTPRSPGRRRSMSDRWRTEATAWSRR